MWEPTALSGSTVGYGRDSAINEAPPTEGGEGERGGDRRTTARARACTLQHRTAKHTKLKRIVIVAGPQHNLRRPIDAKD